MKVKVKGYDNPVTLVGSLLEVPVGSVLLVDGEWKVNQQYGNQFVAQSWEEVMPATIYGIEKYLGSGLVKGIGPKFAKAIVNKFGLDTINVIENDIDRLKEVPNLGKKRIDKIRESLGETEGHQKCYGLSPGIRGKHRIRRQDLPSLRQGIHHKGKG